MDAADCPCRKNSLFVRAEGGGCCLTLQCHTQVTNLVERSPSGSQATQFTAQAAGAVAAASRDNIATLASSELKGIISPAWAEAFTVQSHLILPEAVTYACHVTHYKRPYPPIPLHRWTNVKPYQSKPFLLDGQTQYIRSLLLAQAI